MVCASQVTTAEVKAEPCPLPSLDANFYLCCHPGNLAACTLMDTQGFSWGSYMQVDEAPECAERMALPLWSFFINSLMISLPSSEFLLTYTGGRESRITFSLLLYIRSFSHCTDWHRVGQERLQRKVIFQVETQLMKK